MAAELIREEPHPAPEQTRSRRRPRSVYDARFLLVYAALGAAALAAVAGLVLALTSSTTVRSGPAWSEWRPSATGLGAAEQIAKHVGAEYRLGNGNQIVDVIARPPAVTANNQQIPIGYIAARGANGAADLVASISPSNSIMYTLCGLGDHCSIATGKPSIARGRLVRREILELALYTFRYDSGIDDVIALMPPKSPTASAVVVFLQRSDLAQQLREPLRHTLAAKVPSVATMTRSDRKAVDAATGTRSYSFSVTRAQDGNAILILAPLTA